MIREFVSILLLMCVYTAERMCVFFEGRHNGRVMEDDSFPFLIAMVPVAWLPGGGKGEAGGAGRVQTQIFSNEY